MLSYPLPPGKKGIDCYQVHQRGVFRSGNLKLGRTSNGRDEKVPYNYITCEHSIKTLRLSLRCQHPQVPSSQLCFPFSSYLGYTMIFSIFAAGLLLARATNAFWRLPCQQPVLDARVDPIIDPGGPSGHVHTIMGSNGAHVFRIRIDESKSDPSWQPLGTTLTFRTCEVPNALRAKSRLTSLHIGFPTWYVTACSYLPHRNRKLNYLFSTTSTGTDHSRLFPTVA